MEYNHHPLQQPERKYNRANSRAASQKLPLIMTYLLMMSLFYSAQSAALGTHQNNQQYLTLIKPPSAAHCAVAKNAQVSAANPIHILFPLPIDDGPHNDNNPFGLTILKAQPVVDEAVETVYRRQLLPPGSLAIQFEADKPGDPTGGGPNLAISKLLDNRLDCVIGYASVYSLAPVARMSPYWRDKDSDGIPVITSVGLASYLDNRQLKYQLLTRISGSYKTVASALLSLFQAKGWKRSSYLLHEQRHNDALNPNIPYGECYRLITSIKPYLYRLNNMENNLFTFNELSSDRRERIKENLRKASRVSNVIILCAGPDTVRDIMLAGNELGMTTSGEYAFINIDIAHLTGGSSLCMRKPCWLHQDNNSNNMTSSSSLSADQNEKAKLAYRALKSISLRQSDLELEKYKKVEARVKERAEEKYNYSGLTGKKYEMNYFVSVFSDALLLYAIALNETLAEGLDPRNGKIITSKMWNRTFVGMAGKVSIDQNGDRCSDYSLLDSDPTQQDKFVEVAYYSAKSKELKHITQDWLGEKSPKDAPVCGWDHSECLGGYPPTHVFAMIGLSFLVFILLSGFVLMFYKWPTARNRHQRGRAEGKDDPLAEQYQQENGQ